MSSCDDEFLARNRGDNRLTPLAPFQGVRLIGSFPGLKPRAESSSCPFGVENPLQSQLFGSREATNLSNLSSCRSQANTLARYCAILRNKPLMALTPHALEEVRTLASHHRQKMVRNTHSEEGDWGLPHRNEGERLRLSAGAKHGALSGLKFFLTSVLPPS
jgi:hypothetical protein